MEVGEKRISADLPLPVNEDYFVLCQPKFEIVKPPPPAVLFAHTVPSVTVKATPTQLAPTIGAGAVTHAVPPQRPIPRTRSISRPLPREPSICSDDVEGSDRSSFSRQNSIRRLPSLPRSPRSAALPSVIEKRETPPPPYLPAAAHSRQRSLSSPTPSHSHSSSLDSVASDISGSTLFGSTERDGPTDDDFPSQK